MLFGETTKTSPNVNYSDRYIRKSAHSCPIDGGSNVATNRACRVGYPEVRITRVWIDRELVV